MPATPVVQAVGTVANGSGANSVNVTLPACQDGDLLVICYASRGGGTTTPSGWTRDANDSTNNGALFVDAAIFTKKATTADSGAVVAVASPGGLTDSAAVGLTLRTPNRNRPVVATATNDSAGSQVLTLDAGTTSAVAGNLLALHVWAVSTSDDGDVVNISGPGTGRAEYISETISTVEVSMLVETDTNAPSATRTATWGPADGMAAVASIYVAGPGGQMAVI